MRTTAKTITRREHWRWQRCGIGRTELRRVLVRASRVTLPPTDTRQLDLLDGGRERAVPRAARRRGPAGRTSAAPERAVIRSYWRNQPHGPGRTMRRMTLVDVHA